jgi:hypothetical protein
VARASGLRNVGPFDTVLKIAAHQDMFIRLTMEGGEGGEVEFVAEPLTIVYDTQGSLIKMYAAEIYRHVLPMIRRHIERRRQDLSSAEVCHILGVRYTSVGRNLYRSGATIRGVVLLAKAILLREYVLGNLVISPHRIAVRTCAEKRVLSLGAERARIKGRRPNPSA